MIKSIDITSLILILFIIREYTFTQLDRFRKWINRRIIMKGIYEAMFSRNQDLISIDEQNKIKKCTVAIAGMGGIGGLLAERLIRVGVRHLKITDPGSFETSNINRQYASNIQTRQKKKARVVYEQLRKINPESIISYNTKGIGSQKDADEFINGASVVVDAMDFGLFKQAIYLQRAARNNNKYYMFSSAIGFGTLVVIFKPKGYTLEQYNGYKKNVNLDTIDLSKISTDDVIPDISDYIKKALGIRKIKKIVQGLIPVPVNSIGVGLSSIVTANEVINIIIKKKPILTAPHYLFIDLLERKYEVMEKGKQ